MIRVADAAEGFLQNTLLLLIIQYKQCHRFYQSRSGRSSHTNTIFSVTTEFTHNSVINHFLVLCSSYTLGLSCSVVTAAAAFQITVYSKFVRRLCWCKQNPLNFTEACIHRFSLNSEPNKWDIMSMYYPLSGYLGYFCERYLTTYHSRLKLVSMYFQKRKSDV